MPLTSPTRENIRFEGKIHVDVVALLNGANPPTKEPSVKQGDVESLAKICHPAVVGFEEFLGLGNGLLIVSDLVNVVGRNSLPEWLEADRKDGIIVPLQPGTLAIKENNGLSFFR